MSRWKRFWLAFDVAWHRGHGLGSISHALQFTRNRGRITRQQRRAYDRKLAG